MTPPGGWRTAGWTAVAVLTAVAIFGLTRLRIDDDLRALVRAGNGDFQLMDEVAGLFGAPDRDCIVRAAVTSGDIFDAGPLEDLRRVADRLRQVSGVAEVRSVFDVRRQGAVGAVLPVIPRRAGPLEADDRAAARERATTHPLVSGHLLSADATSSLLLARLDPDCDRPPELGRVIDRLEDALRELRGTCPTLDLQLTGLPALREQAARALRRDMLVFTSLGLSLAVVLSAAVARSLRSTVVACVPPFFGAIWALGVLGLVGAPVNILTCVVPSLALVVGTCDSIHFIEDMRRSARRGIDPVAASGGAILRIGRACGITSLVTAIGFA
ncbi:MAG: MMPL family transporter, partial [Planctomycetaceae bacterium]